MADRLLREGFCGLLASIIPVLIYVTFLMFFVHSVKSLVHLQYHHYNFFDVGAILWLTDDSYKN